MSTYSGNVKEWEWYEAGKNYNTRLEPSYYDLVDINWDFFYGNQWANAGLSEDLPQPVFNNINRFVTFFVAFIMSSKSEVRFESPIIDDDDNSDDVLNQSWKEFEERVKLVWKTKNALYDGAVTGDYVAHLRLDPSAKPYNGVYGEVVGEIDLDLVSPTNLYVANPNSEESLQKQDYVQIAGRDLVKNLQKEAKKQEEIQADNDTEEQAGRYGKIEMDSSEETDKATYVITYTKKKVSEEYDEEYEEDGEKKTRKAKKERKTVHATKCTANGYIYKDIDLGIELYPVAHGNWELQRNTYHGMSFVRGAIPTQIFINRGFAMAMFNVMTAAFPKMLYHKDKISGISTMIGGQIGVELGPNESLADVARYLEPGNMSGQVVQMIELAQTYMQDAVGASDSLLGNVNPEQASGASISVASKQAGIPLENPEANMYNWLEDIGRIYLDMASNLYGERPVIMPTDEGAEVVEFDFESLKGKYKKVKVNVGPSTYWSALAQKDTMDNLLMNGYIEFVDYLEGMTDEFVPNRQEMIDKIKEKQAELEAQQAKGKSVEQEFLAQLTPDEQQAFLALPEAEQQAYFDQYQGGV